MMSGKAMIGFEFFSVILSIVPIITKNVLGLSVS